MVISLPLVEYFRVTRLMEHCDDHNSLLVGVIKQRVRKTVQQDTPERPMNDLKCQRMSSDDSDRPLERRHEIVAK